MKFIPFDKIDFKTKLTFEEVENILKTNTHVIDSWGSLTIFSRTNKLLEGEVSSGKFRLKRHINYRNSFLPIMFGDYSADNDGTIVSIRFRLYTPAIVLAIVFLSFGLIFVSIGILQILKDIDSILPIGLLIMLSFYTIMFIGFNFELRKSKRVITELLKVASS